MTNKQQKNLKRLRAVSKLRLMLVSLPGSKGSNVKQYFLKENALCFYFCFYAGKELCSVLCEL